MLEKFKYRNDKVDRWTILSDERGWEGDCEDFAMTVAWGLSGQLWLRFWWMVVTLQIVFWHAKTETGPHVMLWVSGKGWIDNWYPTWNMRAQHQRQWPYVAPLLAIKLLQSALS